MDQASRSLPAVLQLAVHAPPHIWLIVALGIALSALIMAVQSPFALWDVGFQLSLIVMATPLTSAYQQWLALLGALVWAAALSQPDGRLHVTFLDVGQGDATQVYISRMECSLNSLRPECASARLLYLLS